MLISVVFVTLMLLMPFMTVVFMIVGIFGSFFYCLSFLKPNRLLGRIADEFSEAIDSSSSSDAHKSHSQSDGKPNISIIISVSFLSSLEIIAAQAADTGSCRPFCCAIDGGAGSE